MTFNLQVRIGCSLDSGFDPTEVLGADLVLDLGPIVVDQLEVDTEVDIVLLH